ncbi:hypothetical protein, partial [Lactiplantibacillus plantarum]
VIGMPRFVFPQIIPEFLVFRQSLVKKINFKPQIVILVWTLSKHGQLIKHTNIDLSVQAFHESLAG